MNFLPLFMPSVGDNLCWHKRKEMWWRSRRWQHHQRLFHSWWGSRFSSPLSFSISHTSLLVLKDTISASCNLTSEYHSQVETYRVVHCWIGLSHNQMYVLSERLPDQPWLPLFVGLPWNIAIKDTRAQSLRVKDLSHFKAVKLKKKVDFLDTVESVKTQQLIFGDKLSDK